MSNPEFQKREIKTFCNIKKSSSNWFIKYKTILAYLLVTSPLLIIIDYYYFNIIDDISGFLIISLFVIVLITSSVGVYNTYEFVPKKRVMILRYLIFSLGLLPFFSKSLVSVFSYNTEIQEKNYPLLDGDPNNDNTGFLYLSLYDCIPTFSNNCRKTTIHIDSIINSKNNSGAFKLKMELINIGSKPIDSAKFYFNYDLIEQFNRNIRIQATVINYKYPFSDIVRIEGLDKNQSINCTNSKTLYTIEELGKDSKLYYRDSISDKTKYQVSFKSENTPLTLPSIPPAYSNKIKKITIVFDLEIIDNNYLGVKLPK